RLLTIASSSSRDSVMDMLIAMRSSGNGRMAMALPSSVCSRHTNPGLWSARALMGSSCDRKPSMIGSSSGARMRPMFACARWYRVTMDSSCRGWRGRSRGRLPVALGGVAARQQPRRLLELDLLHEHTCLAVGQVGLALARGRDQAGRRLREAQAVVHAGEVDRVLPAAHHHRLLVVRRTRVAPPRALDASPTPA